MKILQDGQIPYTAQFSDLLEKDTIVASLESAQDAIADALKLATSARDDEWSNLVDYGVIANIDPRNGVCVEFLGFSHGNKVVNHHLIDAETED